MATTKDSLQMPHLAEALDRGLLEPGDIADLLYIVGEGDLALTPDRRSRSVELDRAHVAASAAGEPLTTTRWDGQPSVFEPLTATETRRLSWQADLCEQPDLLERVLGLVDADTADEVRFDLDRQRHPFPLDVDDRFGEEWLCGSCGTAQGPDDVGVAILDRDGHYAERSMRYCAGCITLAATACRG